MVTVEPAGIAEKPIDCKELFEFMREASPLAMLAVVSPESTV